MDPKAVIIRKAVQADSDALWELMRQLAVFEKYIDQFAITPDSLRYSGFRKDPPDFYAFIAEAAGVLAGMLVYYFLPFTAQNRPAIYMKELYVDPAYRGAKLGQQLMQALRLEAERLNCCQIKWTVAPWNEAAIRFYERLGAKENTEWLDFEWRL